MRANGDGKASIMRRADQTGIVDQPGAQRTLLTDPVQGMRVGTVLTMRRDRRHNLGQRFDRRYIAVQHLERLAVVLADPTSNRAAPVC